MDENAKRELREMMARMNDVEITIDEGMTLEQLRYFMKGYEYCYDRMLNVVGETYREFNQSMES